MGLLVAWYNNFFGAETVAVLPYDKYLKRFPAYFQQFTMESLGKSVTLAGQRVDYQTGQIYWGEPGPMGNTRSISSSTRAPDSSRATLSVSVSRSTRLATITIVDVERLRPGRGAGLRQDRGASEGRGTPDWLVPHRVFEGNRPSNTILLERLTPDRWASWWRSMSTASSSRAPSGTSTRSISGAWNWVNSWRTGSCPNFRAR